MASSLEEELKKSSHVAHSALELRRKELAAEEEDIADSRIRYETERMLDFYDELSDRKVRPLYSRINSLANPSKVAEEVAAIIQRFVSLEKVVGEATTAGLRLTSLPCDETTEVQRYNDALHTIGESETGAVISPTLTMQQAGWR